MNLAAPFRMITSSALARRACLVATLATLALGAPVTVAAATYRVTKTIPVGGEGGWDYLSVDLATRRLYVAHATHIVVIDTRTDKVVGDIPETPGVHGIAIDPIRGIGYTSNGRENTVGVVNPDTLQIGSRIPTGKNPDAIQFCMATGEVYAFNGRSSTATVIDSLSGKVVTTLPLPGKPEFAQCDPNRERVYVNLEDKSEIAAIDARGHSVVATWPLAPGEDPTGLAFDAIHRRLFSGCANSRVVVLDADSGKVVATIPAGKGIDAVGFDPDTGLIFASNGRDGTLTIAHENDPDHYSVVQTLVTAPGARTLAVDPISHKVYLATAKFRDGKPGWKNMIPDSFEVLVAELSP